MVFRRLAGGIYASKDGRTIIVGTSRTVGRSAVPTKTGPWQVRRDGVMRTIKNTLAEARTAAQSIEDSDRGWAIR